MKAFLSSLKAFFSSLFTRKHLDEAELDLLIAGKVAAEVARVLPSIGAAVPALGAAAAAAGTVAAAVSVLAPKASAEIATVVSEVSQAGTPKGSSKESN